MKDVIHSILKFIDHERYKVICIILAIISVFVMVGCEIQTTSPISGQEVTRQEFTVEVNNQTAALEQERLKIEGLQAQYNLEVEELNQRAALADEDFTKKEVIRQKFLGVTAGLAMTAASGGTVTGAQVLSALITLGGIGGTVGGALDAVRKNKIIAETKT